MRKKIIRIVSLVLMSLLLVGGEPPLNAPPGKAYAEEEDPSAEDEEVIIEEKEDIPLSETISFDLNSPFTLLFIQEDGEDTVIFEGESRNQMNYIESDWIGKEVRLKDDYALTIDMPDELLVRAEDSFGYDVGITAFDAYGNEVEIIEAEDSNAYVIPTDGTVARVLAGKEFRVYEKEYETISKPALMANASYSTSKNPNLSNNAVLRFAQSLGFDVNAYLNSANAWKVIDNDPDGFYRTAEGKSVLGNSPYYGGSWYYNGNYSGSSLASKDVWEALKGSAELKSGVSINDWSDFASFVKSNTSSASSTAEWGNAMCAGLANMFMGYVRTNLWDDDDWKAYYTAYAYGVKQHTSPRGTYDLVTGYNLNNVNTTDSGINGLRTYSGAGMDDYYVEEYNSTEMTRAKFKEALDSMAPGSLVIFTHSGTYSTAGNLSHVGIYIGEANGLHWMYHTNADGWRARIVPIEYYSASFGNSATDIGNKGTYIVRAGGMIAPEDEAYVFLEKSSENPVPKLNEYYDMSGIKYDVYKDSELKNKVGVLEITEYDFETGVGKSSKLNLSEYDPGDYWVKEDKDSVSGTGFLHNESVYKVSVTEENTEDNPAKLEVTDKPISSGVKFSKVDRDLGNGKNQGDASLQGGEISIYTMQDITLKDGTKVKNGDSVITIKTDGDGNSSTAKDLLPIGKYYAIETKAPTGYNLNKTWKVEFDITEANPGNEKILDMSGPDLLLKEDVIKGGIKLGKIDRETAENKPQAQASLKGAELTIYNNSAKAVKVDGVTYEKGKAVKTVTTDENGLASVGAILPYGTYYVKETKAPKGYNLNSEYRFDFSIRKDGEVIDATGNNRIKVSEQIKRMDLRFYKYDMDGSKMAGIPFVIERLNEKGEVVEAHVIVSDREGLVDTSKRPKTGKKVNSIDAGMNGDTFDEKMLDESTGVWFGEESAKDEKLGALIYAQYRVRELQIPKTMNMDMLSQDVFEKDLSDFVHGGIKELTNVFIDLIIHPESKLRDDVSRTDIVTVSKDASVTDEFRWDHLKIGQKYKLETVIIHEDIEGNKKELGRNVKEFTPSRKDATNTSYGIEMNTVRIDTSGITRGRVHAVDYLYAIKGGKDVLIASHNTELNTESQTLDVPYMSTSAKDTATGSHIGAIGEKAEIVDTITYENLPDKSTYKVSGRLIEKGTGKVIDEVSRVLRISSSLSEVRYNDDGSVSVPRTGAFDMPAFVFDARGFEGKTLYVEEVMYDFDTGKEFLSHTDPDDENQIIRYSGLGTSATDENTGTRSALVGKTTIIDKVTLYNVVNGEEYVITGDLVYKEDCVDSTGKEHKKGDVISSHDGVKIIADVPTGENMEVELKYEVDASALQGISGVVVEDEWYNGVLIAKHHDYDDERQTPNWPGIKTKAWDKRTKSQTVRGGELKNTIVDTVSLTNLTVGENYTISGTLYKPDGTPFLVDGEEITVTKEFTAKKRDMEENLEFESLNGEFLMQTLVVYEKLIHNEAVVAKHEDPGDKNQTVKYEPSIGTKAKDKSDGDNFILEEPNQRIVDTVKYQGLRPGQNYVMQLEIFDVTDNKLIEMEPVTKEFTASDNGRGEIEMEVMIDGRSYAGHKLVVFEECFYASNINPEIAERPICSHKDKEDDNQTIYVPSARTKARNKATGKQSISQEGKSVIVDTVYYSGLKPGKTYRQWLTVYDKDTKEPLRTKYLGVPVKVRSWFTPSKESGEFEIEVEVDGKLAKGKTLVLFEETVYDGNSVICHFDINDKDQTINVEDPKNHPRDIPPEKPVPTGDNTTLIPYVGMILIAGLSMIYLAYKKRK